MHVSNRRWISGTAMSCASECIEAVIDDDYAVGR